MDCVDPGRVGGAVRDTGPVDADQRTTDDSGSEDPHEDRAPGRILRGDIGPAELAAALDEVLGPGPGSGPALLVATLAPPTPVSTALLERLVDELSLRGHEVTVGASLRVADRDRGLGSIEELAVGASLRGRTARGTAYVIVDLHADLVPAAGPPHSLLADAQVSRAWRDATVRVLLARAVTDLAEGYAACLDAITLVARPIPGADPAELAVDLAETLPPALCVVDALAASGGADGRGVPHPQLTRTVIVAADPVEADATVAELMAEDRSVARPVAEWQRRHGPVSGRLEGDHTPWPGFTRADPGLREARRRLEVIPSLSRLADAVATTPQGRPGAARDPLLRGLQELYAAWLGAADQPAVLASATAWLSWLATLATQGNGWLVAMAKDRVPRVVRPLGFDPAQRPAADYDALPGFLAPFAVLADRAPERASGLRWTRLDGAIVFRTERVAYCPFAEVVERVDVAAGISLMADYLGGRRVTVTADELGRPVRQAERNVYLPQPNSLAGWGQRPIDVLKVELVERTPTEHRLHWRTIASPNGSARSDDGTLTITDAGAGRTLLSVTGRQEFTLPPGVSQESLAAVPGLLDAATTESYRRFFGSTFDNLEAVVEGRPFRVGAPPEPPEAPLLTDLLRALTETARDELGMPSVAADERRPAPTAVDLDGFAHFRGPVASAGGRP